MAKFKLARTVMDVDAVFTSEEPSYSISIISSNSNVVVGDIEATPFRVKFSLTNISNSNQLVNGTVEDETQNVLVFGKTMHKGSESKVERTIIDSRISDNQLDFVSEWVQDRESANAIADWVQGRMGSRRLRVELSIMGNPLIEVADIITIKHHESGLSYHTKFVVNQVSHSWESGLSTTINAVEA